jgi:hypothetical protein
LPTISPTILPTETPGKRPARRNNPFLSGANYGERTMGSGRHRKAALVDKRPRFPLSLTFRKPTIVRLSALWFPARTDSAVFFRFLNRRI